MPGTNRLVCMFIMAAGVVGCSPRMNKPTSLYESIKRDQWILYSNGQAMWNRGYLLDKYDADFNVGDQTFDKLQRLTELTEWKVSLSGDPQPKAKQQAHNPYSVWIIPAGEDKHRNKCKTGTVSPLRLYHLVLQVPGPHDSTAFLDLCSRGMTSESIDGDSSDKETRNRLSLWQKAVAVREWTYENGLSKTRFVFSCFDGATAKCAHWGYIPGDTCASKELAPYHAACVYAARAVYKRAPTGRFLPFTCQNTQVDFYDRIYGNDGINKPMEKPLKVGAGWKMKFEAGWNEKGVVLGRNPANGKDCLRPRWQYCESQIRSLPNMADVEIKNVCSPPPAEHVRVFTNTWINVPNRPGECVVNDDESPDNPRYICPKVPARSDPWEGKQEPYP